MANLHNPFSDNVFLEAIPKEKQKKRKNAISESIALIANNGGTGVVIEYHGDGISASIDDVGSKLLSDQGLDNAPDGISIWEGKYFRDTSNYWTEEVDCSLEGIFRDLTDKEWCILKNTGMPWEFEDER